MLIDVKIKQESVPLGCDNNVSFLVDIAKLDNPKDLTCDDIGKYSRLSTKAKNIILSEKKGEKHDVV